MLPPSWLRPLCQQSAGNARGHQETVDRESSAQTASWGWGAAFIKLPRVSSPLVDNTRGGLTRDEAFILPPAVFKSAGSPHPLPLPSSVLLITAICWKPFMETVQKLSDIVGLFSSFKSIRLPVSKLHNLHVRISVMEPSTLGLGWWGELGRWSFWLSTKPSVHCGTSKPPSVSPPFKPLGMTHLWQCYITCGAPAARP